MAGKKRREAGKTAKRSNDMLSGNVVKSIILFSLPIMFSSLLQFNYTLVDNIIVGRYVSTDALAAVGNVGSINSFIIGAALGLTSGFTIPVAHSFGAGEKKKAARFAGNSIALYRVTIKHNLQSVKYGLLFYLDSFSKDFKIILDKSVYIV